MNKAKTKHRFFSASALKIGGVLLIFLLAIVMLWHGNATSSQAESAMMAQVYFDGEYRIADGEWQEIEEGKHIPSTKGDVILRGNFHLLTPEGEYIGIYTEDMPIAMYLDHISLTLYEGDNDPYVMDTENLLYGDAACGESWSALSLMNGSEEPIEMRIHNPHRYGNETAIDELLSKTAFWAGVDFEKSALARGDTQRDIGLLFVIVSLVFLGTALFSSLIHTKNSKIIWVLGAVILFSGTYLSYSAEGVSFWSDSVVSNTTLLGCSMMFYMLFLSMAIVHLLKRTKAVATVTVTALGAANAVFILLPLLTDTLFYDMWFYWTIVQGLANAVLLGCLVTECCCVKGKMRWLYVGLQMPLFAFALDAVMTDLGLWKGGIASEYVFIAFFIAAMIAVLRVIPHSINAVAKTKELETERIVLNAELTESRISTMMSQIRPHFIYNTLGSIEQLCNIDPPKAGELVHNFAKYLRGNFGELDNHKPILMSREMEHVRHYISIENVRLEAIGMEEIFERNNYLYSINPEKIDCDYFNHLKTGKPEFLGEYMYQYSWAEETCGLHWARKKTQ